MYPSCHHRRMQIRRQMRPCSPVRSTPQFIYCFYTYVFYQKYSFSTVVGSKDIRQHSLQGHNFHAHYRILIIEMVVWLYAQPFPPFHFNLYCYIYPNHFPHEALYPSKPSPSDADRTAEDPPRKVTAQSKTAKSKE